MTKYLVILKYTYNNKQVRVYCNDILLDPRHCYLMSRDSIQELDGWFSACFEDTEKNRTRQIVCAKLDGYEMKFIEIKKSDTLAIKF